MRKLPVLQAQAIAKVRIAQSALAEQHHNQLQDTPTCRRGCASCCHHPILISVTEGTLLYWHLRNNGLWTKDLKDNLEDHARRVVGLSPAIWMLAEIPCPLLSNTKECRAYKARPLLCRTAYSYGDPDLCAPSKFSVQTPMADRQNTLRDFYEKDSKIHKSLSASYWQLPLSLALLIGSKVGEGKLSLSESEGEVLSSHLESES